MITKQELRDRGMARADSIRALVDQGLTCSEIAARLGIGKGAVTGLLWRKKRWDQGHST
jgi:transposase